MPSASMSKVTSICGTPRGAGGMPTSSKRPSVLLSFGHLALALHDVDAHHVLVVLGGREDLALRRGHGGVALDDLGRDPALRLDAERERRHVEQQHVRQRTRQHAALDRRARGDHLVGVHALVRAACRRSPPPCAGRPACASCRPPGSPRRCSSRRSCASASAFWHGSTSRPIRSATSDSSLARVSEAWRCFGPSSSAAMKGRLMSVSSHEDSSCLARSAASLSRCSAILSERRSMPCVVLEVFDQELDDRACRSPRRRGRCRRSCSSPRRRRRRSRGSRRRRCRRRGRRSRCAGLVASPSP